MDYRQSSHNPLVRHDFSFWPSDTRYFSCQITQKPLNCYESGESQLAIIEAHIHIEREKEKE